MRRSASGEREPSDEPPKEHNLEAKLCKSPQELYSRFPDPDTSRNQAMAHGRKCLSKDLVQSVRKWNGQRAFLIYLA